MYCGNCKSDSAIKVTTKYHEVGQTDDPKHKELIKEEYCNQCYATSISPSYARDAMGNKVIGPKESGSFYSYATDKVHTGTRDFAEHLKKEGLVQKDGACGETKYFRSKKRS